MTPSPFVGQPASNYKRQRRHNSIDPISYACGCKCCFYGFLEEFVCAFCFHRGVFGGSGKRGALLHLVALDKERADLGSADAVTKPRATSWSGNRILTVY